MTYPFYNPREVDGATLETMLVGRWPLVEEILSDLRRQATSASRQHWLLRGPRGIGKTHLIGVVYHRVGQEPDLEGAYLPVWLAEMEAYTFYSTAILLLEVAGRLAEELRLTGDQEGAGALEETLARLEAAGDDPALFEEVLSLLRDEAKRRGKILLILIENLDAMLVGFRSRREARRFRALLSEAKELLFLSSTPTRYLRQLSDPEEPLYGHLKERTLEPLTEQHVGELFGVYAESTGEQRLKSAVGAKGEGRLRRRVLHRLTGGNPRALVMAFSVLSGASGLRSIVAEMEALLDAQTAYFEAQLARMAPRERSIVAAMALAPTNLTRQGIARATRLPERSLSTQLKRLVADGHLGHAVGEGGKGTIYELSDRLFRTWFQYRKGRKKLEPLVRFLALWYEPEELERARVELEEMAGAQQGPPLQTSRMEAVVVQVAEALRLAQSEDGMAERERLWSKVAEEALGQLLSRTMAAIPVQDRSELEAVEQQIEAMLEGETLPDLSKARALALLCTLRGRLGRYDEALEIVDQIVARYGDRQELPLAVLVATVLLDKGNLAVINQGIEALEVYDQIVARYSERQELPLAEMVATALLNKGDRLHAMDQYAEALEAYDQIVTRYADRQELPLAEHVVRARVSEGLSLGAMDRYTEALEVNDQVVTQYADRQELPFAEHLVRARVNTGYYLGMMGQYEEALEVFDQVVARYGKHQDLPLAEGVAWALVNKGYCLGELGRNDEALQVYDQIVTRYADRQELPLAGMVAKALFSKGARLSAMDRDDEAFGVYDQVVAHYGELNELSLAETVATALVNKGVRLGELDRNDEALEAFDQVIEHYAKRDELPLAKLVADALFNKGNRLGALDRNNEALEVYDEVMERYAERDELPLAELVAKAHFNKGNRLGALDRTDEALEVFEQIVARYAKRHELTFASAVAMALSKIAVMRRSDEPSEAIRTYRDLLIRLEASQFPELRGQAPFYHHVLTALEAARPRRGARGKKGPAARLREALGQVPPELRETVREITEGILFGQRQDRSRNTEQ